MIEKVLRNEKMTKYPTRVPIFGRAPDLRARPPGLHPTPGAQTFNGVALNEIVWTTP